jgi:hypothetical protein
MNKGAIITAFRESIEGTGTPLYPPSDKKDVQKSTKENIDPLSTTVNRPLFTSIIQNSDEVNYPVAIKKPWDDVPKDIKFRVDNVIPGLSNERRDLPKFLKVDDKPEKAKKELLDIYQKPVKNVYWEYFWSFVLWILSFFMTIQKPQVDRSQIDIARLRREFDSAVQKGDDKKAHDLADKLANFYKKKK